MKSLILISLLSLLSFSQSLPHFTYDGLESFHDCSGETEKISFTIYGTLSEELNPRKMFIKEYIIDDMGEFQCSLNLNEDQDNERRTHKITCTIHGSFEHRAYILDEPKVYGFDFLNEYFRIPTCHTIIRTCTAKRTFVNNICYFLSHLQLFLFHYLFLFLCILLCFVLFHSY